MLKIYKGNLYNQLDHKIDSYLLDSSQYDLRIQDEDSSTSYRVRYQMTDNLAAYFLATEIQTPNLKTPRFNEYGVPIEEIQSFLRTSTFNHQKGLTYKDKLDRLIRDMRQVPDYYAFLQRVTSKKKINNSRTLYHFTIPAVGTRAEEGISSYDVKVEIVQNFYYVVFYLGNVERGYTQKQDTQFMIYNRPRWYGAAARLDEKTIDLAIKTDSPLNLTKYVMIMTGGDRQLTIEFLRHLKENHSLLELCQSPHFGIIKSNLDENLERELTRYMKGEQDDIEYNYKRISLSKK